MSSDEAFLEALAAALDAVGLEALVVGMTGAALQGVPAMTEDVDLLVRDTDRNRQKLEQLCAALGGLSPVQVTELAEVLTLVGGAVPVALNPRPAVTAS